MNSGAGLELERLTIRFGGLQAVGDVTVRVPPGQLTGLIGPNGAGKTTTFNACSGLVRPTEGRVLFDGRDVTRRSPAVRARGGLGRTFQRMELFDSLPVTSNVAVGRMAASAGSNPWRQLVPRRREGGEVAGVVDEMIGLCGLEAVADRRAGELSTGQRRLVELARVLAGRFQILLLDEPSSGLDHADTDRFGAILRTIVDTRGTGILLVEHDMSLVMSVCDCIHVLEFGRLIFSGTPAEVRGSDVVKAAYLGQGT